MNFTDDKPVILEDVRPIGKSDGPVALSNHSRFGFNIRHFYLDWKTHEYSATRKGVSFAPADLPIFLRELATFINANNIIPDKIVTITIEEA